MGYIITLFITIFYNLGSDDIEKILKCLHPQEKSNRAHEREKIFMGYGLPL